MLLLVDGVEAQSDHDADGVAHLAGGVRAGRCRGHRAVQRRG